MSLLQAHKGAKYLSSFGYLMPIPPFKGNLFRSNKQLGHTSTSQSRPKPHISKYMSLIFYFNLRLGLYYRSKPKR
jgi:hypothetical protein